LKNYPLLGLSVVKNEADIIEVMVRHNLQFVDYMVFFDNGSIDGTAEILLELAKETGKVEVRFDGRNGHLQQKIINTFLREHASDYNPKHVILLDADELIVADSMQFKSALLGTEKPVSLPWKTFVATPLDDLSEINPLKRILHCRSQERPRIAKTTVPRALIGKARVVAGSHALRVEGATIAPVALKDIELAHYPVRSKKQILAKALIGHWNICLRTESRKEGKQWHAIAEQYLGTGELKDNDFFQTSLMYASRKAVSIVCDPMISPSGTEQKYRDLVRDDPLLMMAHFTESLIAKNLKE